MLDLVRNHIVGFPTRRLKSSALLAFVQIVKPLAFHTFEKKRDCTIRVAKTKALISLSVTVKLICAFGFAYAN